MTNGFAIWMILTFVWSNIFGAMFTIHVVKCKKEGERWSRGMLAGLIFFVLLWLVPLCYLIVLLFAFSAGLTAM